MTTLDELRRANLLEQRRKMEAAEAEKPADKPVEPVAVAPAPAQSTAPAPSTPPAAPVKPEPTPTTIDVPAAHVNGNGHVQSVPSVAEPTKSQEPPALDVPAVDDDVERKARVILDRFYRGLSHKVIYPTGVKATVDMPPELFWRVKRYCHDHNNVTVRQLFLDLVIALLDEEGY